MQNHAIPWVIIVTLGVLVGCVAGVITVGVPKEDAGLLVLLVVMGVIMGCAAGVITAKKGLDRCSAMTWGFALGAAAPFIYIFLTDFFSAALKPDFSIAHALGVALLRRVVYGICLLQISWVAILTSVAFSYSFHWIVKRCGRSEMHRTE